MTSLSVSLREPGNAKALISAGDIPAVVYGPGVESISVRVSLKDAVKAIKSAGESTVVTLTGLEKPIDVLIHEIDRDPVTHEPRHLDFYRVSATQKVEVEVPVEFINDAPATKLGASIVKVMHEISIEALPKNLPHAIEVDLSQLQNIGDHITLGDLKLPTGVEFVGDAHDIVVSAAGQQEEVEDTVVDMSSIEVEQKGKKVEENV